MNIKILTGIIIIGILFIYFKPIDQKDFIHLKQFNYPVLKGKENNPVLRICYVNNSNEKILKSIKINLVDTQLNDVDSVSIFYRKKDSVFRPKIRFGRTLAANDELIFNDSILLNKGKNYLWVSYQLSDDCSLNSEISTGLDYMMVNNKKVFPKKLKQKKKLRTGIALRQHWDDGVHTYRIPGLVTSNKGTLLAVYDVRRDFGRDLQGNIDIGLSRSTDQGESWEPMKIIMDMKT
jgi:sialidase-1